MAVEQIIELLTYRTLTRTLSSPLLLRKLSAHNDCAGIAGSTEITLACKVDKLLEDLRVYLEVGSTKTSFGIETDCLLAKLPATE